MAPSPAAARAQRPSTSSESPPLNSSSADPSGVEGGWMPTVRTPAGGRLKLKPGMRAKIEGLHSRLDLNGMECVLVRPTPIRALATHVESWDVQLAGTVGEGELLRVMPANLVVIAPPASAAPTKYWQRTWIDGLERLIGPYSVSSDEPAGMMPYLPGLVAFAFLNNIMATRQLSGQFGQREASAFSGLDPAEKFAYIEREAGALGVPVDELRQRAYITPGHYARDIVRVRSALVGEDEPVARPVAPEEGVVSPCEGAAGRQFCHEFGHGIAQIHEPPEPPSFVTLDCPHTPNCVHRVSRMPQIWTECIFLP